MQPQFNSGLSKLTGIRDKTGNGERRANTGNGKRKNGNKEVDWKMKLLTGLEFKLIFVLLFIFPRARSPFSSVIDVIDLSEIFAHTQ